ncbi:MAG: adenylate/guanylate cyclase domain-containing protein [Melioribacteraceae bacterium]|nr:adenylate/guanylate cyclase domain-containing protein [Melioribacteraceae bacterium]
MKQGKSSKKDFSKFYLIILAFILSITLTQELFFTISPLKKLELKFIDSRFSERGPVNIKDSSKVIILEITQDSYDQIPQPYNKWPWARSIYVNVIENLTEAGVKAIGIDINMLGPDQFSPKNDSLMKAAIRKSGKVVLAGKIDEVLERSIDERNTLIQNQKINFSNIFYDADSSIGIVQLPPDYDGVFRRYLPYVFTSSINKNIPSFGGAVLNKYYNLNHDYTAQRKDGYFDFNGTQIPMFDNYTYLINFYGPSSTFPKIKFIDVLDDKDFLTTDEIELEVELNTWDMDDGLLQSGIFKDKVVLIGSTMPEDRDLFPTSFAKGDLEGDNLIYGVEIHANAINNVLNRDFLSKQSKLTEILEIIILVLIIFFITDVIRRLKLKNNLFLELINLIIVSLSIFLLYQISIYFFITHKLIISIIAPAVSILISYFASTAYHFIKERQQNVLIKGMFSTYVSKDVVNELLNNPDKLKLGGEKKNVTILFSDIAGFTTFSEGKQPEELVLFINEYLNEMTDIVLKNEGTLDKYLGDAIMAFWGAPLEVENHAHKACITALEMQKSTNEISKRWISTGEQPLKIRIGINSGEVIVGNMGGVKRFDYTVMGDNVNLASRLEGANKQYNSKIMIGESTYELIKDKFLARELDLIKVKGKVKPTKVFELIGLKEELNNASVEKLLEDYSRALNMYKQKEFEQAKILFDSVSREFNDDTSKIYSDRCQSFIITPPDVKWDGVFELKTK